ncbi:MAG: methionyl-tRNA formyltransferase [Casimicrobiaceae bacterium]
MRVGFAGTPAFAATALDALCDAGYTIPVVLTQPDRPKGRGLATAAAAVKARALARGRHVLQPVSLKPPAARAPLADIGLDVLVVAAYGLLLPQAVLDWPRLGCLNIHASLLPRWRGAAPVARAIEAGDDESGVTIMQMDAGLDTGASVARRTLSIDAGETAGSLTARLAALGATTIVDVLRTLARGDALAAVAQPAEGVTYARKVERAEARIDWQRSATAIERQVRAFDPWPVAWTALHGETLKVWRASVLPGAAGVPPGSVLRAHPQGLDVGCGEGALRIHEVQPANARRMPVAAWLAARAVDAGTTLGA